MEQATAVDSIVVGYDGSPSADCALRWAVAEGRLRNAPVRLVHIVEWPVIVVPGASGWLSEQQRLKAKAGLDEAMAAAGGALPVSIVEGSVAGTICEMSRDASMIVLGSRGHGGFSGLLIGSVSMSVAVHAACPVVVVRGGERADPESRPVTVGVDDSAEARLAARFGFQEAQSRGCGLVAIRAWHPAGADPTGELETAERVALREVLDEEIVAHRSVPVATRLVVGRAAKTLIDASKEAQLVVVGSRGMGGFKGLLLGSVGQQLLHHGHCPVMVVR